MSRYPSSTSFHSRSPTRHSTRHRARQACPYQALCHEYVLSLGWPKAYFNAAFNRCYCAQCYPEDRLDFYNVASAPYVIPRGWVRVGLYVDDVKAKVEDIWNSWITSYHGTNVDAAKSITAHRQFLLPGDKCEDGRKLGTRCLDLYTSPTIRYSARDAYAQPVPFISSSNAHYQAKIVYQCKQKLGTFKTQGATGGARLVENRPPNIGSLSSNIVMVLALEK